MRGVNRARPRSVAVPARQRKCGHQDYGTECDAEQHDQCPRCDSHFRPRNFGIRHRALRSRSGGIRLPSPCSVRYRTYQLMRRSYIRQVGDVANPCSPTRRKRSSRQAACALSADSAGFSVPLHSGRRASGVRRAAVTATAIHPCARASCRQSASRDSSGRARR
jgi:hypothetical protein